MALFVYSFSRSRRKLAIGIDFVIVIRQDAQDPDFQSMLRAVGSVQQIPDPAHKTPLSPQV